MSSDQELNSFLSKFLNLLHCGQSAKLVLECHQGQAYVNLHHALHLLPQEPCSHSQQHHGPTVRRQGPSRQRRRVRRALARANAEAAKASDRNAETATLKSSDVAVQATVSKAEKASQSCFVHHHRGQAEEECSPPPHEPAEQVVAPSFCGRVGHHVPPQHCAAHVEPVCDVFCDDLEYSAGQAVPQVDGCLDISSTSSPTLSSVSAAGIQQLLAGSWPGGITRDIQEEEKRKKEREKDLEYIENLVRTNLNY